MFRCLVIGVTLLSSADDASAEEKGALPAQCPPQVNKENCRDYLVRQKIDEIHAFMLKAEVELQRYVIHDSKSGAPGTERGNGTTREPTNHAGSTAFVLPQTGLNHWGPYTASGQLLPGAPIIQGGYYNLGPAHPISDYTEAGIAHSVEVRTTMAPRAPTYHIIQAPLIPSPSVEAPLKASGDTVARGARRRAPSARSWSVPGYYGVIIHSARIRDEKPSGRRWDAELLFPDSKSGPDPFVVVEVGEQYAKSKPIQDTWNPEWNVGRLFWLEPGNAITIKVMDEDVAVDDSIATVSVPFRGGLLLCKTLERMDWKNSQWSLPSLCVKMAQCSRVVAGNMNPLCCPMVGLAVLPP